MNTIRSLAATLIAAGALSAPLPALGATFDATQCAAQCRDRHTACWEGAKDSPNDIDRELCTNERKECFAACEVAAAESQKEEAERQRLEREERARLGIEEPRLSNEEEEAAIDAQAEREAQEKQEREAQAAREEQERQEKAAQEKREEETLNGIPIYQFK